MAKRHMNPIYSLSFNLPYTTPGELITIIINQTDREETLISPAKQANFLFLSHPDVHEPEALNLFFFLFCVPSRPHLPPHASQIRILPK